MTVSMVAAEAGQSKCDWSFRAEGVTKIYGKALRANDSITLSVRPGEVYGLLGPNGAEKTTLVKQVIGLLKPDQGLIRLGPFDLVADPDAARQLCSYLPQAPMPIDSFRVREAIELTGRIRGGDRAAVRRRAGELTTGTPTLALIPLGFVLVPASVGHQKLEGTFDFIWSLPVPRSAQVVSTFLLFTLLSLPGAALALVVSSWYYGVSLSISVLLLPGALLCAVMAVSVGFGMALLIANPLLTNLVTNALMFVVLLFTPIVFPPGHLPEWLFAVDRALPFYNMAEVIRAGLTTGLVTDLGTAYLILSGWTVAGWVMTAWVAGRRR